jgi:hypothetical protein
VSLFDPFTRGPRAAVEKWNAVAEAFRKGLIIESDEIGVDLQPDGRMRLFLKVGRTECECILEGLASCYSVTSDCFAGTVYVTQIETGGGAGCQGKGYSGDDVTGLVLVFADYNGTTGKHWQLGFDYAEGLPILQKTSGDCTTLAGHYEGDGCSADVTPVAGGCCPDNMPRLSMTVTAEISGSLLGGSECEPPDTEYAIAASATSEPCVGCEAACQTPTVLIDFTCPGPCVDGSETHTAGFNMTATINQPIDEFSNWSMTITSEMTNDRWCGGNYSAMGGDDMYELDLGSSTLPMGTHTIDFDDPNFPSVHYHLVVVIAAAP